MKLRRSTTALAVGAGLALCAGIVLAQQFGRQDRPGRLGPPAGRPGTPGPEPELLFASDAVEVEVTDTDQGADVAISTHDAGLVEKLQQRAEATVKRLRQLAKAGAAGPRRARPLPGGAGQLARFLRKGDVHIEARNTDDGVILSFTTPDKRIAQRLQNGIRRWVTYGRLRVEMRRRGAQMREALSLLASDDVRVEVKQTDEGITVNVTSDKPEVVKQIKEKLAGYYSAQKEFAGGMQERTDRDVAPRPEGRVPQDRSRRSRSPARTGSL